MSNEYPETIYLVPTDLDGPVWETEPAPGEGMDPADAVRYVRADRVSQPTTSNDKMREAFETLFPTPEHIFWNVHCEQYDAFPEYGEAADEYHAHWVGYKAALTHQQESEPVAFAKNGNLFWNGDPTEMRGVSSDLYAGPPPAAQVPEGLMEKSLELCAAVENEDDLPLHKYALRCGRLVNEIKDLCAPSITEKRQKTPTAAGDVIAERQRQVTAENWTPEHDDNYSDHQLTRAAICYADPYMDDPEMIPAIWPWEKLWWKPKTRRQDLVRAGALILAEIERLDRSEPPEVKP